MNTFLRNLSPSHQVGLLFVLVFGILAAISVAAFVMSLKDTHEDDLHTQKLKDFNGLLRTSWLMSTVFWIGWTLGETVATFWLTLGAWTRTGSMRRRDLSPGGLASGSSSLRKGSMSTWPE